MPIRILLLLTRRIGTFARLFAPLCRPTACTKKPYDTCLTLEANGRNSPGTLAESGGGPFPLGKCAFLKANFDRQLNI